VIWFDNQVPIIPFKNLEAFVYYLTIFLLCTDRAQSHAHSIHTENNACNIHTLGKA